MIKKTITESPLYTFYSWNENITKEELCSQMKEFSKLGITGVFIHARGGLSFKYFGKQWFDCFSYAIDIAKEFNLEIGIYDENGWPSGYGNGYVNGLGIQYWQKKLRVEQSLPDDKNIVLLASYRKINNDYIICDKIDGEIFAFIELNPGYVDILSEKVVDAFIKSTHEVYKDKYSIEFGKTIKYIFTDEPQLAVPYAYTEGIEDIFYKEYGYDMLKELWRFAFKTNNFSQFHYDYRRLIGKLFHQNYTKKISNWCEQNNLLFTGHFACEENTWTLNLNGGVQNGYKYMQVPGIDTLGHRCPPEQLFETLVSCKNIFKKQDVLSETFGCSGWGTTLADFKYLWSNQVVRGVSLPCLHLSAYSIRGIRKRDYPAFFSYQEPWWKEFNSLTSFMKHSSSFVNCNRFSDVLILSSDSSALGLTPECEIDRQLANSFASLISSLTKNQIAFDIVNEEIFDELAKIENLQLVINDRKYKTLIISSSLSLLNKTNILIKKATEQNIPIAIADNFYGINLNNITEIFSTFDSVKDFFWKINYRRVIAAYNQYGEIDTDIIVRKYERGFAWFNTNRNATKRIKIFADNSESLEIIDSATNQFVVLKDNYGDIDIQPGQLLLAKKSKEKIVYKDIKKEFLLPKNIKNVDKNAITLDVGQFSFDRHAYSDKQLILDIEEKLSKDSISSVWVKYEFNTNYIPKDLSIAVENVANEIYINGVLCSKRIGWFVDKSIEIIDISKIAKIGNNIVEILYSTDSKEIISSNALDDANEINRNLFSFDLEIESIYVIGSFFVDQEKYINAINTVYVDKPLFTIVREKDLFPKELTTQGLWFYRGNIEFDVLIPKLENNERGFIQLIEGEQCSAKLQVNGVEKVIMSEDEFIDVTSLSGKKLKIVLTISNRNLLGPHHHVLGEPFIVGGNTYCGVRGFEDEFLASRYLTKTRVDGYYFKKNIFPKIQFITRIEKD